MSLTPVIPGVAAGQIRGLLVISVSAVQTIFVGIDAAGNFFINGVKASPTVPVIITTSNINFSDAEVPIGSIDGVNTVFTLLNVPKPQTSLQLFRNGLLQQSNGADYSASGGSIFFATAPGVGDILIASYRF